MAKYTHVIWDWNGTLLNDISASLASVNDMLALRGRPPMDIDFYRECIGVPIIRFYEKAFDMENEDYEIIIKQYNEGYLYHLDECKLTDGVIEVLDYFEKTGAKQAVISSSNNNQLIQNVTKYGIFDRFDAVLGADDYYAGSKIERAENYLNSCKNKCKVLVIGDIVHDADMAKKLGADCVLLTSGHENRDRLYSADATVISDVRELIEG